MLVVGKNDDFAEYRYAVKHCSVSGVEDTWIIGGMEFDQLPTITVYPKIVNGGAGTNVVYAWWSATSDEVVYTGYTIGATPTVFNLTSPSDVAGQYTVDTVSSTTLTITTTEEIPTEYTKE